MTMPSPRTDHDVLADLAPLLTEAWEHGGYILDAPRPGDPLAIRGELVRKIRHHLWEARRLGVTARQISAFCRIPGAFVIRWMETPEQHAEAYAAEIHHLERELAAVRLGRAWYVRGLHRTDARGDGKSATKVELAKVFGVSRPTIDAWIDDASTEETP